MMKSDNRAKVGLLQPLEIPSRKWAHVTTDLITDLPESNGIVAIIVFVDKIDEMVHSLDPKREHNHGICPDFCRQRLLTTRSP